MKKTRPGLLPAAPLDKRQGQQKGPGRNRGPHDLGHDPEKCERFSEKIMLKQRAKAR
jgi:hypothetical protein